ncbi:sigma-70 family RNA polymerase sigma factor [Companilactobacillus muriivasis]|uniref:sigma-70 family RNA polymerase sigma factor n=1 Tax=Companilactobacillus muriivasis TaxID=3081444 RepID=UPI0030C7303F
MLSEESLLIEQVRNDRNSPALVLLVNKYRPMIDNLAKQYFITSYERDDWYQEAYFTCFQSCQLFDGSTGSKFGSFFKMKFTHCIIDLIRYENANKRKVNGLTESLDEIDQSKMTTPSHKNAVEDFDNIRIATTAMNLRELIALRYVYGRTRLDDACLQADCDAKALKAAAQRCKRKIKEQHDNHLS